MIVLDTHALIWWIENPEQLTQNAQNAIQTAQHQNNIHLSSMTIWEINMLVKKERLTLKQTPQDWIKQIENLSFISFTPVNNQIAQNSVWLDMHPDPADRMITATTLYLGASLITKDEKLQKLSFLNTIW